MATSTLNYRSLTPASRALLPHLRPHLTDQFKLYQQHQLQRFETLLDAKYNNVGRSAEDDRVREQGEWEERREEFNSKLSLIYEDAAKDL